MRIGVRNGLALLLAEDSAGIERVRCQVRVNDDRRRAHLG
jgi:hypothetical protein